VALADIEKGRGADMKTKRVSVGLGFLVLAVVLGFSMPVGAVEGAGIIFGLVIGILALACIISSFLE